MLSGRSNIALRPLRSLRTNRANRAGFTLRTGRPLHGPHAVADRARLNDDGSRERKTEREAKERAHQPPPMP
ncbi:hypothetical protein GCM10008965_52070 [Methylorubrum aminovorans]|nr:hypothetical protein GCM10025880_07960 [Methylorubrum aminovorans]